ncbi:helix-turn-helix domain-containing protein [Amycolatopsis samaneae]|uniref:Helix-turn-helix domain-containing protein n=1 Tax=Amycolatopsis samaneae TaxID=664691 RepID=A0ABW5G956_9PSEU
MNAVNASTGEQSLGPTARRMILGSQLRRLREEAGITRQQAGYSIRGSESKISRLELGRVGFKERDVTDLLTMYGVSDEGERDAFLELVKQSNEPGWWRRFNETMPTWMSGLVGLEEAAARIQIWEPLFVSGLLQTEEYARSIVSHGRPDMTDERIDQVVALRMRRQKMFSRPDSPRVWTVLDESILHRPIGGAQVLKRQLEHLMEMMTLPHVSVQILPYDRSGLSAEHAFSLLRFAEPELPNIAYVEYLTGAHYLEKRDEIEKYSRALDMLAVDAETPDRSRTMIAKRRQEI